MQVAYFVHNLNDHAVAKRVTVLKSAGCRPILIGFWRGACPPANIAGAEVLALDRTYDGKFAQRAWRSLSRAVLPGDVPRRLADADIFLARNLEMLAIASSWRRSLKGGQALAYEVLDVHRLLTSRGPIPRCMRMLERALLKNCDLLIVSSPAFLREYFEREHGNACRQPTLLFENKTLADWDEEGADEGPVVGPPWRIGWLGVIRCRASLELLADLAARRPDLLRVQISGCPTQEAAEALERIVPVTPAVSFDGPYGKRDLARLYRGMHFNWAIDWYEEGANSRWLLPNRIYEGGRFDAVPLALEGTEVGRWLQREQLGVLFKDPRNDLETFLDGLSVDHYRSLKLDAARVPRSRFIAGDDDFNALARAFAAAMEHRNRKSRAPELRLRESI